MNPDELERLASELASLPHESEWVEFKHNHAEPEKIGEYISALSNSAALLGRTRAFILWGLADGTHEFVGTSFRPHARKLGNEELEGWLSRQLSPRVDFRIHEGEVGGKRVVVFEIPAATHTPIRFSGEEYIRVGSYKKKLKDFPEKERALWAIFSRIAFENGVARAGVSADEALQLIDYPRYFEMADLPLPQGRDGILSRLADEKLIAPAGRGKYDVTNLGGILFARNLEQLGLARKGIRVIVYQGANRIHTLREQPGRRGYAAGFEGMVDFINAQLPQNEEIGRALRREERMYPEIAIRELAANALIHQDFAMTGTGPIVEVFSDRIEITNPGIPLIDTQRFLDLPPVSRNEALAAMMRRFRICEERGSGIDKVVFQAEVFQLPAPDFQVTDRHTRAVLYAYRELSDMSREDRIRACYQHAALQYVSNTQMTNTSLRQRFSISQQNYATASRIIADTLGAGLIKPFDPENRSKKHAKYVPFWA
jgi:ATP-dependent DNA helicase RecG